MPTETPVPDPNAVEGAEPISKPEELEGVAVPSEGAQPSEVEPPVAEQPPAEEAGELNEEPATEALEVTQTIGETAEEPEKSDERPPLTEIKPKKIELKVIHTDPDTIPRREFERSVNQLLELLAEKFEMVETPKMAEMRKNLANPEIVPDKEVDTCIRNYMTLVAEIVKDLTENEGAATDMAELGSLIFSCIIYAVAEDWPTVEEELELLFESLMFPFVDPTVRQELREIISLWRNKFTTDN